jgi:simple sugar transport system ATP-binding protein
MLGISKRFGHVVANDGVSFDARYGEVHALVGENGAGKSTLMSVLAGIYRADSGSLAVNGQNVEFKSPRDAIASGIGMVYQHFRLVESFTVAENVALGAEDTPILLELRETAEKLRQLGKRFGLEINPDAKIWQLSVGEQQRVEILRLLHRGARILVFDEPTAVLTPQESESLIATLREMAAQGFCVIFISHKLTEVLTVADRITVLRRGRALATREAESTTRAELAQLMVGRELAVTLLTERHVAGHETQCVRLSVSSLAAQSDTGLSALRSVSFDVRGGEILGIAGVAGNGQRELAETLTGLRPATSGSFRVNGVEMTNQSSAKIARAGVAHVPEDRIGTGLVRGLDLAGNAILRAYRATPISRGPFISRRAVAQFADRLIASQDVQPAARTARLRDLSGGNQQKLLIARELAMNPTVMVAVHPTRGVDVGASEAIHAAFRELRDRDAATLLISEDLDELFELCDRIAVLYDGAFQGIVPADRERLEEIGLMMAGGAAEQISA